MTPELIDDARESISALSDQLMGMDLEGAAPEAAELYCIALTHLEQAERHLRLAGYAQSKALVSRIVG